MLNKILGFLGWTGSILVLAAVLAWLVSPELAALRRTLALAGLACIVLYGAGHWRQVGRSFARRQTRYGALAGASVLLVLTIVTALNYVLARQNRRWDLTAGGQYSLSDQTRQVLDTLAGPVLIRVFAPEPDFPRYRNRLDEYAYQSSRVTVDYVDPDRQPTLARQHDATHGTILFEYEGRVERIDSDSEQELTNALIKVVEGAEQTVYFLEGHGERAHAGSDRDGYSAVADALALDNFTVEPLVLAQAGAVPEDATVVVVAGPRTDLLPGEVDALRGYLDRGGKLLLLLDPPDAADEPAPEGLLGLVREWGIEVGADVVVDVSGVGRLFGVDDVAVPVAANYPFHPITERFNLLTAYSLARSVSPASDSPDGRVARSFIETGPQSWQEADIDSLLTGQVEFDEEAGDRPGPVGIGAAVSAPAPAPAGGGGAAAGTEADERAADGGDGAEADGADSAEADGTDSAEADGGPDEAEADDPAPPETRLAVIGDSDFASNAAVGVQGNRDLFLNTVNWLARQENLISIRARAPEDRRLTLTAGAQRRIFWLSVLFLPAAILGAGVYAWLSRR